MVAESSLAAFDGGHYALTLYGFVSRVQKTIEQQHSSWEQIILPQPFIDLVLIELEAALGFFFDDLYLLLRDPEGTGIHHCPNRRSDESFHSEIIEFNKAPQWLSCNQADYPFKLVFPIRQKFQLFVFFQWKGSEPMIGIQESISMPIAQALDQIFLFWEALFLQSGQTASYRRMLPPKTLYTQIDSFTIDGIRSYSELSFNNCSSNENKKTLTLAPVTVFSGKNSSGKSTLLKALGLLRNTQKQQAHPGILVSDMANADLGLGQMKGKTKENEKKTFSIILKYCNFIEPVDSDKAWDSVDNKDNKKQQVINAALDLTFLWLGPSVLVLEALNCHYDSKSFGSGSITLQRMEKENLYQVTRTNQGAEKKTREETLPENKNLFYLFHFIQMRFQLPWIFPDFTASLHILNAQVTPPRRVFELSDGYLTSDGRHIADEIARNPELANTISEWLIEFEFAVKDENKQAFKMMPAAGVGSARALQVYNGEDWIDLFDMGSGVAHLIPIILRGFIGNDTDTVILENPEHHLHHEAQSQLVYLLRDMAKKSGYQKRIIVETQSVYLIKQIQLLALEDNGFSEPPITDIFKVYYFDIKNRHTRIYPLDLLNINESDEPPEFLNYEYQQNLQLLDASINRQETI